MTIGAVAFQPYVYTVNSISPASMNRLSKISDDVLDKKIDYSELAGAENENPLKKGQTLDFQGMLNMQMQRGRYNASRIMKPAEETAAQDGDTAQAEALTMGNANMAQAEAVTAQTDALQQEQETFSAGSLQTVSAHMGSGNTGNGITNFRMQQAINAYEMFMTA